MRKTATAMFGILSVLILTLGFTGCPRQDDGRTELRVLNYFSLANPGAADELRNVWEAFERDNPDIRLVREDAFDEAFHQTTEAYAAAGMLPHVIYVWPSGRSTTLHANRLLRDLTPFVARDNLAPVFVPAALDPAHQAGHYLAMLPLGMTTTSAFYVNMEVLRSVGLEPARTYAELVAQVPILAAAGYETIIMANMDTWVMQSCLFSLIAGRFAGEGWEQRILGGQARFTDPDFVEALRFVQRMYQDGVLSQTTLFTSYGETPGLFATNRGAYMIDGDWRVGAFITDRTTGQALISPARQEDVLITVFPYIEGARINNSATVVMGVGWAMSTNVAPASPTEDAAWRLIRWLTGREVQTLMVETGGLPSPSRTDIDFGAIAMEPMQRAVANLGNEFTTSTVVIDAVFASPVFGPLNDGLQAIGMGIQTPEEVAQVVQAAFDAWRATQ